MKKILLFTICLMACMGLWAQEESAIKVTIASATASSSQSGEGADRVLDGDLETLWHSPYGNATKFPIELTISFDKPTYVDFVRYTPRPASNTNGNWGDVQVSYCSTTNGSDFTSHGTYALNGESNTFDFGLAKKCGQVKFTINSGAGGFASAAEIAAYACNGEAKYAAFEQYFTDGLCTVPSVTNSDGIADADVATLVEKLLSTEAEAYKKFRVGEYEPYKTLASVQKSLGTKNPYNKYENPTGVYFTAGKGYWVAVSGIGNDPVYLRVKNWYTDESSSRYSLQNGLNYIDAQNSGNTFVSYYTDNTEAKNVKLHFINAEDVIGYWDSETMNNEDWKALLADKASDDNRIIITRSEHAQLAFPISAWKEYCSTDVVTTMTYYQQVQCASREMLGLDKYSLQTKNRQLYYATNYGFMAASEEGAYCNVNSLGAIMKPDNKTFDFWGVGHEWGHNNQIPGFLWSGCGETTNNIYAAWAQSQYTGKRDANDHPTYLRLEDEVMNEGEFRMRGGRMQAYFEEGLRKGVQWQLQEGSDYYGNGFDESEVDEYNENGEKTGNKVSRHSRNFDHFVKLSPFWQLLLWDKLAEKCPNADIITDVIHAIRTTEDYGSKYNTNGKQQINWMKLACDVAKMDLLPFFEKAGMLKPINAYIEDYGSGWNIITEGMIADLKNYVEGKGYATPKEEINYINGHNYHIYRDNKKLNVTKMQGELNGDMVTIQHSVAQNAVAFETYNANNELIRITMYGLGSDDAHAYTQVLFPSSENATYIMAVGYDGERQKVYQKRTAEELQTLIADAESLLNEVAKSVTENGTTKVELSESNYYTNAECKETTYGDQFTSYGVLCDNNPETFLHTDYSEEAPNEDHYIRIDLGSGNELTYFNLSYTTRKDGNTCAPKKMAIEASNNGTDWVVLRNVTSDLNTGNNATNTIKNIGDGNAYRYIRMRVFENSTNQTKKGHYYFIVSELGLEKIELDVTLDQDYQLMSKDVVIATYIALQFVQNATEYTNTYADLFVKYDALLAARQEIDCLAVRETLRGKIDALSTVIAECGVVDYGRYLIETPIALQVTDENAANWLSTNADQNVVGNSNDGDGIAALIDNYINTYMHTQWGGTAVNDDHYVQVSLGEGNGLNEFTFTYATRKGSSDVYTSPAPTIIELYGSNDGITFTGLNVRFTSSDETNPLISYKKLGEYWASANIKLNQTYNYLRFYVKESRGPQQNTQHGGHYYFAMSEFAMTGITYDEDYYVKSLNPNGSVTEEQLLAAYRKMVDAEELCETCTAKEELEAMAEELEDLCDELSSARNTPQLPVVLTTDMETPVLYTLHFTGRGDNKVLQYDPADCHQFSIVDANDGVKQMFYFTVGDTRTQVYVHPFVAGGQLLAAENVDNGAGKVFAKKKGEASYEQWVFEKETDNYNLKPVGQATYFSNFGGGSNKMGFYSSKDAGSRFTLAEATVEGSSAYHSLKVYYDEAAKTNVTVNNPGYYRGTNAYAQVYESAAKVLENTSSADAAYLQAYYALHTVNEALEMILPAEGKYYVIRSAHNGYAKDALVYVNEEDNKLRWSTEKDATDATAIWTIVPADDGTYTLCNLSTGTYINGITEALNETAGGVTMKSLSPNGQVSFHSNDVMMHAQYGGAIVNYTTGADGASAWRIEEVGHAAKIGEYKYTSLYLSYPTTIPDGVEAYIAVEPSAETIKLVKLEGGVLPAETGVILYSATATKDVPATYNFLYTTKESTDDVSKNLLEGSDRVKYVGDGAYKYYIFGQKNGEVGLYWARMDYDADGNKIEGEDQGTHFKASANKVYFAQPNTASLASGIRFVKETTGIDVVESAETAEPVIYTLYGQRISKVAASGIYIINGEKRYINVK